MADKISKTHESGLITLQCNAGSNMVPQESAPANPANCIFQVINHSINEATNDNVTVDAGKVFIHSQIAQNVVVKYYRMGGVIPTLLLALSGAGVRHERQADSTKYTNRACTRNKFCLRRREVFRCNFPQKFDRSKSSLHSYVPKWVGRIRFGTSHISSGYKFYLLCKEQFICTVDDWLRLDSRWIDGLAVKAA